jgi:hypothetical protein
LRLPPSLHSQTARASQLRRQKITPHRYTDFSPAPFRLKAALPALFFATPTPTPDHPPLKQLNNHLICVATQVLNCRILKFTTIIFNCFPSESQTFFDFFINE